MVHARSSRWPDPALDARHPQPSRITGWSLAILINLAVFLLLSLPRSHDMALPKAKPEAPPTIVALLPPDEIPVPPEVPPLPVPPERVMHTPQPVTTPVAPVVEHAALPLAPIEVPLATPPPPSREAAVGVAAMPSAVRYILTPPPPYPRAALRSNAQGNVLLRVLVGIDGRARSIDIAESSGHTVLDRAAHDQVLQRWRFEPARLDGRAVEAWVLVPIEFTIPRG